MGNPTLSGQKPNDFKKFSGMVIPLSLEFSGSELQNEKIEGVSFLPSHQK